MIISTEHNYSLIGTHIINTINRYIFTCLTLISAVSRHTSTVVMIDLVITRPLILTGVTGTLVNICQLHVKHAIIILHKLM